ncbi:MAG TPA: hypothetical protein G4O10_09990 [Dehalococcoidia bacterium]|nr:hypothetical protein [Dehalococcoidia bacterium]
MWRSKKFIISTVLVALVLAGSIGGIVYAQDDEEEEDTSPGTTLLEKVADKLGIDQQQLKDAFDEAIAEMRDEAQLRWLEKAVEEGWLTEEEAQQYGEWWQARPDIQFNFGEHRIGIPGDLGGFRIRGRCGPGIWYIPGAE